MCFLFGFVFLAEVEHVYLYLRAEVVAGGEFLMSSDTTSPVMPYISSTRDVAVERSPTMARSAWAVETLRVAPDTAHNSSVKAR